MALSLGLLLRLAWRLFVPILVLRLQPSSLWWSQPLPSTAACPCSSSSQLLRPQPEAKTRGHTDTEQPNMLCGTSCCLGVVCLSAGTVEQPVLVRSGVRPGPGAPNEGSAWEATCGAGQVTTSTVTTSTGVLSGSNLPLLWPSSGPGLGHGRNDEVPHQRAPCWLLARGCANCLAPLSCLRSQFFSSPRGPPNLQARGSGSRSGRCHPNGHRRLATPIPFSHPTSKTATLRHPTRHAWAQVLTRALATVAHRNDDKAWRELCMLPKCVLCAPTQGGRQHRKATAAYTLDRLHRWQEGERLSLWDSLCIAAEAWNAWAWTTKGLGHWLGPWGAFLSQLTAVVNLLAQGRAPRLLSPGLGRRGACCPP